MVQVAAWTDPDATVLRLTFPDGRSSRTTSAWRTRSRRRSTAAPASATSSTGRSRRRSATFLGRDVLLVRCDEPGGTRIANAATLVSDGSLDALGGVLGVGVVDARRFRMLIELDGGAPHEEDAWIGGRIALGDTILRITAGVARCAMTTHDPDTGQRDLDTLHGDQGVSRPGRWEGPDVRRPRRGRAHRHDPRR